MRRGARFLALAALLAAWPVPGAGASGTVSDEQVAAVAGQLRCVVCQNLSVADSPSEMAKQMRDLVRERLVKGDTPEQVLDYFVDKYGEFVLLAPRPHGFNLVLWLLPLAGLLGGLGAILLAVRRGNQARVATAAAAGPQSALDADDRERVRRELERFRES